MYCVINADIEPPPPHDFFLTYVRIKRLLASHGGAVLIPGCCCCWELSARAHIQDNGDYAELAEAIKLF